MGLSSFPAFFRRAQSVRRKSRSFRKLSFPGKRATAASANTAIIFSLVVNFGLKIMDVALPWGIDAGAAALAGSLFLFITVSLCTRPRPLAPDIEAVMDL